MSDSTAAAASPIVVDVANNSITAITHLYISFYKSSITSPHNGALVATFWWTWTLKVKKRRLCISLPIVVTMMSDSAAAAASPIVSSRDVPIHTPIIP
jgi:hypothetical protein